MRKREVENWALGIIASVASHNRVEDVRVELKGQWPGPEPTARRLAAHCNAALGDDVLWLIGVDEENGVIGADRAEFANWWPEVVSQFDGPVPTVTDVVIHYERVTVVALLIETGAAPFLVRNPKFGTSGGGPVELEVPWREMTTTRSARHADLIRLLVPRLRLPRIEVLNASLSGGKLNATGGRIESDFGPGFNFWFSATLYVVPQDRETVVFPAHRISIALSGQPKFEEVELQYYQLEPTKFGKLVSHTVDLAAMGPSRLELKASADYSSTTSPGEDVVAKVTLGPAGSDTDLVVSCHLVKRGPVFWALERFSMAVRS